MYTSLHFIVLFYRKRHQVIQARCHQRSVKNHRVCGCCNIPLGWLRNRGAKCSSCGCRTCKNCRHQSLSLSDSFICTLCEEERYVRSSYIRQIICFNFSLSLLYVFLVEELMRCKFALVVALVIVY